MRIGHCAALDMDTEAWCEEVGVREEQADGGQSWGVVSPLGIYKQLLAPNYSPQKTETRQQQTAGPALG